MSTGIQTPPTQLIIPKALPHQLPILLSPSRFKVVVCGRRWGKTALGLLACVRGHGPHRGALKGAIDGAKIWWVAPDYPTATEIWRDLKRCWRGVGGDKAEVERRIELPGGGSVAVKSAHDPDRLIAAGLDGLVIDEAGKTPETAWDYLRPTLADRQGWAVFIGTPRGFNWFQKKFEYAETAPHWARWQRPSSDNPLMTPAELAQAKLDAPRMYGQEYEARFESLEGAEWPPSYFDGILFDSWPPDIHTKVLALDPSKGKADASGDYSAFVMLGLDSEWRLWCDVDLDNTRPVEAPHGGRSIVEDGLEIVRVWQPNAFSVETNGFQELVASAFLRIAGERRIHLPLYGVCSTTPKEARIRGIGTYLAQRRLRIKNTRGGRMLVQQLRDFPEGEHDDGPDGLAQAVRMMDALVSGQPVQGRDTPQLYGVG